MIKKNNDNDKEYNDKEYAIQTTEHALSRLYIVG